MQTNYKAIVIKTVMYIPEQTNGTVEHGRGFREEILMCSLIYNNGDAENVVEKGYVFNKLVLVQI